MKRSEAEMVAIPAEIREAIQATNLGYLHNHEEAIPFVLSEAVKASTHGAVLRSGTFIECLMGSVDLPAGTEGWVFCNPKRYYSDYVRHFDEEYPKAGATIYENGCYYTFVTMVDVGGHRVVAEIIKSVDYNEPEIVGVLEEAA